MRLVDLLLTPRQTTSLSPYNGQARDGPSIGMKQAPPSRRSPVHATTHQIADNIPLKTIPRYYNPHNSPVGRQDLAQKSFRSAGALSDLLRSTRSPTAPGYGNRSVVTAPSSQRVPTELARLLQQQDSIQLETLAPDNDGAQHQGCRTQEGCGTQIRTELVTLDKNLNCTIWRNEGVFHANSSSSSASLSPSSSSSSSSKSSIGEPIHIPTGRRVSLLSSDGSELDPRDHILSTMADSDSLESLSSPLEEMEASKWMDQAASGRYGDWQNLEEGEDRESYDVFDTYPLFNFNILGNTLESADSPFTPLDSSYLLTSDDNIAFGNDSLAAMMPGATATSIATDPGSKVDAGLKQVASGCHDYRPHGTNNSMAENMVQAQLSLSNGAIRRQNTSNSNDERVFVAPSYSSSLLSSAFDNEPRSATGPPPSEVVKLLLQNRRQWAPPVEKLPPNGGYRGSRKRTQGSSARETSRAKAPRSSRPAPLQSSERRHSAPSLTRKANPSFVSTSSLKLEDDQSANLERLITELILLESENAHSSRDPSDPNDADLKWPTWESLPAKQERDAVVNANSIAEELFEGLTICPTSDSDLFSSLELESIYSGDCTELLTLQDATRFQDGIEGFNVVIKSEHEKAETPSPPCSIWNQECFSYPTNGFSRETAEASLATQYEQLQNEINGKTDAEATTLEGVLQSKLFLDSPPAVCSESTTNDCATTRNDQAIIDHDYCQTGDLSLPTDTPLLDCSVEQASLDMRRKYSKCCLSRGEKDYSALKSLLLDSNLTEEVRKEAELDRVKSRKNMSEKRTSPVIAEPLRALRCGKGVCPVDDVLLGSHPTEGESPLRLLYKNLTALTGGQLSLKSLFEQLLSSDESSNPGAEDVEQNTDSTERLSMVSGSSDSCQNHPQVVAVEKREEPDEAALELGAPLDLCSGGDIENVIFFDSFEEFYSSSSSSCSQDLEPTAELKMEEPSEGSSRSSLTPCESSRLSTYLAKRWSSKKQRLRHHPPKNGNSGLVGRRDASRTRAMSSDQLSKRKSTQVVTPLGCRVRNARRKTVFGDKRNDKHRMIASAQRIQTVE